jgi:hypothetical protein
VVIAPMLVNTRPIPHEGGIMIERREDDVRIKKDK